MNSLITQFKKDSRQDNPEDMFYAKAKDWNMRDYYPGGMYSDSLVGGAELSQQNPWQGSQDEAKSEVP